jgi:hypothetical protein
MAEHVRARYFRTLRRHKTSAIEQWLSAHPQAVRTELQIQVLSHILAFHDEYGIVCPV